MLSFIKMMLLLILFPTILANIDKEKDYRKKGTKKISFNETTSCEEFAENARFNPYSIEDTEWFVFYYWSTLKPPMSHKFKVLTKKDMPQVHQILDDHVRPFNWSVTWVLMKGLSNGDFLLAEKGDRGLFWMYLLVPDLIRGQMLPRYEVRFKQIGNKYLAAMDCKARTAAIMSRITEVPPKEKLLEEAAKLGYRGSNGKSYLYQQKGGKQISDIDEKEFWKVWNEN